MVVGKLLQLLLKWDYSLACGKFLADDVAGVPGDSGAPEGLHGQRDEADEAVREGELQHQVVHVGPAGGAGPGSPPPRSHQWKTVQNHPHWDWEDEKVENCAFVDISTRKTLRFR